MKPFMALLLVLCLALAAIPAAAEAPGLTVVEENFYLRKNYGEKFDGIYIAKLRNDTGTPLYIDSCTLVLTDAEGGEAGRQDYLSVSGSRYLEPGEVSFISMEARVNEGTVAAGYEIQLKAVPTDNLVLHDTVIELAGAELRVTESPFVNYYAAATVTNTGDGPLSRVNAAVALRADDGSLVQLVTFSLGQNELAAGSTITLVNGVDKRVVDYCAENNLTLADVDACAWQSSGY